MLSDSFNKRTCGGGTTEGNKPKKENRVVEKVRKLKRASKRKKCQRLKLKGPRVKHVCRSASVVLGQPRATFPTSWDKRKTGRIGMKLIVSCANERLVILL